MSAPAPLDVATAGAGGADDEALDPVEDLRKLADQVRRERIPLLVLFSTPGCPYCLEVRRNYLRPRLHEKNPVALIREVDITSSRVIVDFGGGPTTEAGLAKRYRVGFAPVVMLFDANGAPLAEPLVGIDRAGFYEAYLVARLAAAARALRATR